jgi:hypothetical protein
VQGLLFDGRNLVPQVGGRFSRPLAQEPLQVVTHPSEGTGLELARPLVGDAQPLTDLLQGQRRLRQEAQLDDQAVAVGQAAECRVADPHRAGRRRGYHSAMDKLGTSDPLVYA